MKSEPSAKAEMLIRRPVAEVFEAFVNPAVTSKFWFTKGSDRLEPGKQVTWDLDMYGFSVQVKVKAIEKNARILIEWPGDGAPTTVEWVFAPRPDGTTFVSITNRGFSGNDEQIIQQAIGSTEGFSFVLAGLKALLEHNVQLNLVPDRFPDGLPSQRLNQQKATMNTQTQNDYLLLFRGTEWINQLSGTDVQKVVSDWAAWFDRLIQEGKCKGGHPLLVSGKHGRIVTDGPFAESKEAIGGYFHLHVAEETEAIAIAQQCPGLEYGCVVEVRLAERCTGRARAFETAAANR